MLVTIPQYKVFSDCRIADLGIGVEMRERNSLVEAWPMRLKKKPGEKGADKEFQRLFASSSSGAERYVEWVRME